MEEGQPAQAGRTPCCRDMPVTVGHDVRVLLWWSEGPHRLCQGHLCVVSPEALCWQLLCLHLLGNVTGEMSLRTTSSPQVGTLSL